MKYLCHLSALLLTTWTNQSSAKTPTVEDFQGQWIVAEVVGYAGTGGGIPHAKNLLGKIMNISANGIDFNGDHCKVNPSFQVREVDTTTDLRENSGATRNDAELPPTAFLLDSGHCPQVYWLSINKIEFEDAGVFVRAYRKESSHH